MDHRQNYSNFLQADSGRRGRRPIEKYYGSSIKVFNFLQADSGRRGRRPLQVHIANSGRRGRRPLQKDSANITRNKKSFLIANSYKHQSSLSHRNISPIQ